MVEIRLLGPMEVLSDDGIDVTPSAAKERTLLAVLAVAGGVPLSPDRLADALWPQSPPQKLANALQARVSALRRSLGMPQLVAHNPSGYVLTLDPVCVDVHRFISLVADARRKLEDGASRQALALFDEACSLWRGEALADFAYEEFARPHVRRLTEVRLDAEEDRLQLMADHGRCEEAVAETELLLESHPFRERLWAILMVSLYRSNRQAEALEAFQEASRVLGEELGIEPSVELRRLEEAVLLQDADLTGGQAAGGRPHNLPLRLTSLVGRDQEIERVMRLLHDSRAVTLVGPGGVGKTSLALACGHHVASRFPDGVWLAELSSLEEADQVPVELARSLDLDSADRSTMEAIVDHLAHRSALLILDNCERVLDGVAEAAATILQNAPGVEILATSREPLGMPGEILWPTRPLSVPEGTDDACITESDAVRLFVDRASAVDPEFRLTAENGSHVSEICRRLDGLPLAVELAAARMRSLPAAEIARRLEDRFRLLTARGRTVVPRHQTLEATIGWSYDLLSEEERDLFIRLSVFSGGWSVNAAEAVASDSDDALDLLARLVDRSLINVAHSEGVARYSMLETIRAFASRALVESGQQEQVATTHARWFLDLAESAELLGCAQSEWIRVLSAEYGNLRAGITYASRHGDRGTALRLGAALGWWWFFGNREEGRAILDGLLVDTDDHADPLRIPVLQARALLDFFGAAPRTFQLAEESLKDAERLADRRGAAMSKVFVSLSGVFGASVERSLTLLDEAVTCFVESEDRFAEGLARFQRMEVLGNRGSLRRAKTEGEYALDAFRAVGDPWAVSVTLGHLGRYGRLTGQLDWAEEATTRSIEMARSRSLLHTLQYSMTDLGYVRYFRGDLEGAARLFEQAMSVARTVGNRMGFGTIRNGLAEVQLARDAFDEARRLHREASEDFTVLQLDKWRGYSLTRLGLVEECVGNWEEATDHHVRALEATSGLPQSIPVILSLEGLGRVTAHRGDWDRAARLLTGARQLRRRGGLAPTPTELRANAVTEERVQDELGPRRWSDIGAESAKLDATAIVLLAS